MSPAELSEARREVFEAPEGQLGPTGETPIRRQQRQISEHGLAVARGRLEVRMDRTLERRCR
jgi:hypothetical protein